VRTGPSIESLVWYSAKNTGSSQVNNRVTFRNGVKILIGLRTMTPGLYGCAVVPATESQIGVQWLW